LVEKLWPLVRLTFPKLGLLSQPNSGRSALALAENSPTGKPFNLNSAGSAVQFFPILVAELLSGPLSWFGFVDLPAGEARPRAFGVRPAAGVLVDRIPVSQSPAEAAGLVVGDDLTVLIPIDHPDSEIHGLLAQAGELVEASPGGLRYRLTSERVQALFDQGVSGPEMLRVLDEHGATLPQAARAQLDGWWDAYGRVRLYDELTVIELADDRLLPELLAGTSLGEKLIYTFSPRLIAIDASAAGELVAELTRLGHAPRLVEGD
ncbi:MAG TPA: helicase-associated domain-containing protein, partial [Nitrolancea sp.]|nr:helicase-associated domain-containing protein [Nitrolancea sp.]